MGEIHADKVGIVMFDKLLDISGMKKYRHKRKDYFYLWTDEDFSNEDHIAVYNSDLEEIGAFYLSCWSSRSAGIKKINKLIDKIAKG